METSRMLVRTGKLRGWTGAGQLALLKRKLKVLEVYGRVGEEGTPAATRRLPIAMKQGINE